MKHSPRIIGNVFKEPWTRHQWNRTQLMPQEAIVYLLKNADNGAKSA